MLNIEGLKSSNLVRNLFLTTDAVSTKCCAQNILTCLEDCDPCEEGRFNSFDGDEGDGTNGEKDCGSRKRRNQDSASCLQINPIIKTQEAEGGFGVSCLSQTEIENQFQSFPSFFMVLLLLERTGYGSIIMWLK